MNADAVARGGGTTGFSVDVVCARLHRGGVNSCTMLTTKHLPWHEHDQKVARRASKHCWEKLDCENASRDDSHRVLLAILSAYPN